MTTTPAKLGGFGIAAAAPSEDEETAVRARVTEKLAASVLSEDDARRMELSIISAEESTALGLPRRAPGFLLPYFDLDAKPTDFFRVRFMPDDKKGFAKYTKKKEVKYAQPPGTTNEVYLPPLGVNWRAVAENPEQDVVITEGELKAACGTKHGVPTIGLGGVWMFASARAKMALLPIFDSFVWADRKVTICFDSDANYKLGILQAENALAKALGDLGAKVFIARIPEDGDAKVGMDDYIAAHGQARFVRDVIDSAHEYEANLALHTLNEEIVYIRDPGLIYVFAGEQKISCGALTEHAFSNRFHMEFATAEDTKGGKTSAKKRVNTARAWMQWPHRAELRGITFAPGEGKITDSGYLNTWEGWGFTGPAEGDVSPWTELLDHIFGTEEVLREWFERWIAYPIQHPGAKQANAALIWGTGEGTGKTMVGATVCMLYGEHSCELKDSDIETTRNEWAERVQFALVDDITGQDSRKLANRLKTMVTQKTIRLDPKYIPSYSLPDCINYYFTSNDPDALNISSGDRRYMVHEAPSTKIPEELRNRVAAWRETEEGLNAFAWHLLNIDMGNYDPKAPPPAGAAKHAMAIAGKGDIGSWAHDMLADVDGVLERAGYKGDLFTSAQVRALCDPSGDKRITDRVIALEMAKHGALRVGLVQTEGGMKRVMALRNTEFWRRATMEEAGAHYDQHNPSLPGRGKF